MTTLRLVVHGRVQGVGYRNWAAREAQSLGIAGWVRNLPDGMVEMVASAPDDRLARFVDACRNGPPIAFVERIDESPCEETLESGRFVRR